MVTSRPYGVPTGGWKPYNGTEVESGCGMKGGRGRAEETAAGHCSGLEECRLSTIMCPQPTVRIVDLGERMVRTVGDRGLGPLPRHLPVKERGFAAMAFTGEELFGGLGMRLGEEGLAWAEEFDRGGGGALTQADGGAEVPDDVEEPLPGLAHLHVGGRVRIPPLIRPASTAVRRRVHMQSAAEKGSCLLES
ncbi:hypothetical protein [Streptomyces sp. NPDC047042]|uniref:hypothetical protein n=1 Tax=Streptomyces sp. NPDC047042 TaxID=3154807 RepID=UPI0033E3EA39